MAYYEYDEPNYDYFYEKYPEIEFFLDEPPQEYCFKKRRNGRQVSWCSKSLDGSLSDDTDIITEYVEYQPRRYVVPVMYAPVMSDAKGLEDMNDDVFIQENIDTYYNNPNNLEREAARFQHYSQPYYYPSTIQEETESSCGSYVSDAMIEKSDFNGNLKKTGVRGGKHLDTSKPKTQKIKKKCKFSHISEPMCCKKLFRKEKCIKNIDDFPEKLEASNSWTTLKSSHYGTNSKESKKPEIPEDIRTNREDDLLIEKSKSLTDINGKTDRNVKFNVSRDAPSKNVNEESTTELQAVRDTDNISNDAEMKHIKENYKKSRNKSSKSMKNFKLKSKEVPESNTESLEIIKWQNNGVNMDSTTTETSKISCEDTFKSDANIPLSSDTTNITINTIEYKQFIESMDKPLRPEIASSNRYQNHQYDSQNSLSIDEVTTHNSITVNVGDSNQSFLERVFQAKHVADDRNPPRKKINPLVEVPLSISKRTMYLTSFLTSEYPIVVKDKERRVGVVSQRKSFFLKLLRFVTGTIGSVQNFLYMYFLRFILFV